MAVTKTELHKVITKLDDVKIELYACEQTFCRRSGLLHRREDRSTRVIAKLREADS